MCRRPHLVGELPRGCHASLRDDPEQGHFRGRVHPHFYPGSGAHEYSSGALEGMIATGKFRRPPDQACHFLQ